MRIAKVAATSAQASADAFPAIERAYLLAEVSPLIMEAANFASNPDTGRRERSGLTDRTVSGRFIIRNYGKTPATIVGGFTSAGYFPAYPRIELAEGDYDIILGADGTYEPSCSVKVSPDEWEQAQIGIGKILVLGGVSYLDIFGKRRKTRFCWEYSWERKSFVLTRDDEMNRRT